MYRIVIGAYHESGLRALMIVSRLCYVVILKHDFPRVRHNDAIMNICIFME